MESGERLRVEQCLSCEDDDYPQFGCIIEGIRMSDSSGYGFGLRFPLWSLRCHSQHIRPQGGTQVLCLRWPHPAAELPSTKIGPTSVCLYVLRICILYTIKQSELDPIWGQFGRGKWWNGSNFQLFCIVSRKKLRKCDPLVGLFWITRTLNCLFKFSDKTRFPDGLL